MKIFIFQTDPESFHFFVFFAPCQQPVDPWFTLVDFLWTFFNRFFCFLFERVPLVMPTILHARTCVLHHCLPLLKPIHRCFLVSLEIFRPAILVLDVLLFCHPTSLFHILAQSYGSLLHFVWWHFDAGNTTFHSLLFVQLLLILLCRLAILVFDVVMSCQPYCLFLHLALWCGSLFQPVLCKTTHGNHLFIFFKFGQLASNINVFVADLYPSRWPTVHCSFVLPLCHIHFYTCVQLSTKS